MLSRMSKEESGLLPLLVSIWSFAFILSPASTYAQNEVGSKSNIAPLTGISPVAANLQGIAGDQTALRQLGKAFFWDIQAGSEGQACASCHYHAGADIRIQNQVNPGLARVSPGPDKTFGSRHNKQTLGPNVTLDAGDFPFFQLANPANRHSAIKYETNDVFSSAGVFSGFPISRTVASARLRARGAFHSLLVRQSTAAECNPNYDPKNNPFHSDGFMHRKVADRHSPSVINAIYYHRNFWDGRANNIFNGIDPFGPRTNIASAKAGVLIDVKGSPRLERLSLRDASLASQAVGPPLSTFEMACEGRTFADLARRLLPLRPLAQQTVHTTDSLFGQTAGLVGQNTARGLNTSYTALIQKAFDPKYWRSSGRYTLDDLGGVKADHSLGYTQMEHNFSFFWGIALMQYQALLISDKSPFDKMALSAEAKRGEAIFTGKGKCTSCHDGPVFSNAAITSQDRQKFSYIERMATPEAKQGLYDAGFYNIGVRPAREDLGVGGTDPYGTSLSFSQQYLSGLAGSQVIDEIRSDLCELESQGPEGGRFTKTANENECTTLSSISRVVKDGAFKTPTLRNVGLNPPYMHNGGFSTLQQVVEFYNRGGNRRPIGCGDTTGFGTDCSNIHPAIQPLSLTSRDIADLIAFLKSLTDDRVACHSGPFDHPSLPLVIGHSYPVQKPGVPTKATDRRVTLPAVGDAGLKAQNLPCFPNSGNLFGDIQAVFSRIAK